MICGLAFPRCLLTLVSCSLSASSNMHFVSLVISKTFYYVWHEGLLPKLSTPGFSPSLVPWTSDFFSMLVASILVDGFLSATFPVNARGSIRFSTWTNLFLLFIIDLMSSISNPIHSFTDDATLHCSLS